MRNKALGKNNKGGITKYGYKRLTINGKRGLEHRLLMEIYLGRTLLPTEILHHINENKLDNRIENLEITNASDHKKHHPEIGISTRLKLVYEQSKLGKKAVEIYKTSQNALAASHILGCSEMTLHRLIKKELNIKSLRDIK